MSRDWDDDEEDGLDGVGEDLMPCPACGKEIYDDAVRCPECGEYLDATTGPWGGRPTWWMILGLIGIAAVIYVSVHWRMGFGG